MNLAYKPYGHETLPNDMYILTNNNMEDEDVYMFNNEANGSPDGVIICYHNIHEYCIINQLAPNGQDFDYLPSFEKKYYVMFKIIVFTRYNPM